MSFLTQALFTEPSTQADYTNSAHVSSPSKSEASVHGKTAFPCLEGKQFEHGKCLVVDELEAGEQLYRRTESNARFL